DLDADIFDHADMLEAFRQLAISDPLMRIRFLVLEPLRAATDANRLLGLSHRLTSVFAFRTPVEDVDRQYAGSFVISDRGAWFERPLASRFEGEGNSYGPGRRAQFHDRFNAVWERSEECAEMRRLEILVGDGRALTGVRPLRTRPEAPPQLPRSRLPQSFEKRRRHKSER